MTMDISKKLIEMENDKVKKMAMEHAKKLMAVKGEIEQILIKNNMTWRDWGDITKMITDQCIYFFDKTEFLTIKAHEQSTISTNWTERKTEQSGSGSSSEGQRKGDSSSERNGDTPA